MRGIHVLRCYDFVLIAASAAADNGEYLTMFDEGDEENDKCGDYITVCGL